MTRSRIHDENGKVRGNVAIGIAIGVMLVAMIPAVAAIVSNNNDSSNALTATAAEASHTETFRGIKLPQPNDEDTLVKARASGALYEPAAGLSNVFGPGGLFPFEDTFDCADSLACGVSAG